MRGGYKIIDFGNTNITTESGGTISGIYESIENSYRKALLISNIEIDGVEKNDCIVCAEIADGNYTFTAHGKTFTIKNDDTITIA